MKIKRTDNGPLKALVGINEELKATEAARAALSTNPNSKETIRVLRQAKYIAALAMTTLPSDKLLNDARHAVVITLSDLVHALEADPAAVVSRIFRTFSLAERHRAWLTR